MYLNVEQHIIEYTCVEKTWGVVCYKKYVQINM